MALGQQFAASGTEDGAAKDSAGGFTDIYSLRFHRVPSLIVWWPRCVRSLPNNGVFLGLKLKIKNHPCDFCLSYAYPSVDSGTIFSLIFQLNALVARGGLVPAGLIPE
jgi:hypothetical protein